MLAFAPDRLGHAVTAAAEEGLLPVLLASGIPVELCLTSNVLSGSVPSYGCVIFPPFPSTEPNQFTTINSTHRAHHFAELWGAHHPVALCTDDSGVFATCLSREYALAATAFQLTRHQLWALATASIKHCFAPPAVKAALLARVQVSMAAAGVLPEGVGHPPAEPGRGKDA